MKECDNSFLTITTYLLQRSAWYGRLHYITS